MGEARSAGRRCAHRDQGAVRRRHEACCKAGAQSRRRQGHAAELLADDAGKLERTFKFKNFGEALHFVEQAGALAEAEFHHPDISFGWGYATVSLRTKKIKGLHENDFIMATKLDRIAGGETNNG